METLHLVIDGGKPEFVDVSKMADAHHLGREDALKIISLIVEDIETKYLDVRWPVT